MFQGEPCKHAIKECCICTCCCFQPSSSASRNSHSGLTITAVMGVVVQHCSVCIYSISKACHDWWCSTTHFIHSLLDVTSGIRVNALWLQLCRPEAHVYLQCTTFPFERPRAAGCSRSSAARCATTGRQPFIRSAHGSATSVHFKGIWPSECRRRGGQDRAAHGCSIQSESSCIAFSNQCASVCACSTAYGQSFCSTHTGECK